jgi:hypothetical protein
MLRKRKARPSTFVAWQRQGPGDCWRPVLQAGSAAEALRLALQGMELGELVILPASVRPKRETPPALRRGSWPSCF